MVSMALSTAIYLLAANTPWAILDGKGARLANDNHYTVTILAVDGKGFFDGRTEQRIEPGVRHLMLATTKKGYSAGPTYQSFTIDAEPCIRYLVYAEHPRNYNNKQWELVIRKEEKISGCSVDESSEINAEANRARQTNQ